MVSIPQMTHEQYLGYLAWKEKRGIVLTRLETALVKQYHHDPLSYEESRLIQYYRADRCHHPH